MRLLCVGRHTFLSEHLCRYFRDLGAQCEPVVGLAEAPHAAVRFEPQLVVCDADLLTPALMDAWSRDARVADLPVLAVSLTHRHDERTIATLAGVAGVIYLPALDRAQAVALLHGAARPRGVQPPEGWRAPAPTVPAALR